MNSLPCVDEHDALAAAGPVRAVLDRGGIVAHPTETVYGFGCALEAAVLAALARLKRRLDDKPFLVLLPNQDALDGLEWTDAARALAGAFWPGPLTLALRTRTALPAHVVSGSGTVAVRVPGHLAMAALLRAVGRPITSTSANLPGGAPARDAAAVVEVLRAAGTAEEVLVLDAGVLPPSPPSTIVDCSMSPPRVLRSGAITNEELLNVIHDIAI